MILLERDHPAGKALEVTIAQKKEEIKKIQAERQKARGQKHSVRQEADKKEAGSRVAYIKERQRKRAAEHRKSGFKERAVANVAKQEEAERRFNQPGTGVKVKTFLMRPSAKEKSLNPCGGLMGIFGKTPTGNVLSDAPLSTMKSTLIKLGPSGPLRFGCSIVGGARLFSSPLSFSLASALISSSVGSKPVTSVASSGISSSDDAGPILPLAIIKGP